MKLQLLFRRMSASSGLNKPWRKSACMILITGPFRYSKPPLSKAVAKVADVRFGSTPPVILEEEEGGGARSRSRDHMEVLFVQRGSRRTAGWANNYVFPGGVIDKADSSPKWMDIFQETLPPYKQPFSSILDLSRPGHQNLPLYSEVTNTPIAGEIAFRICAIREAFEEAGVLLARDQSEVPRAVELLPGAFSPSVKELPEGVREEWRQRVHGNAEEFLTMCRELHCVPDVWSLIEWSNWLTPHNIGRRFDTVFYVVCCGGSRPEVQPDRKEVVNTVWMGPGEAVERFLSGELQLAPPQFAETQILGRFGTAPCFHSYALRESLLGTSYRKLSIRVLTKDGIIMSITNHDDLYPLERTVLPPPPEERFHHPQSPTLRETHQIRLHVSREKMYEYECLTHTAEELRRLADRMSRMEFRGQNDYAFFDNVAGKKLEDHIRSFADCTGSNVGRSKL